MSIDRIARAAGEDLRAHTTSDVDEGLPTVVVGHAGQHRRTRAAMAVVVAAAVVAGWWGGDRFGSPDATPAPTRPAPAVDDRQPVCRNVGVTCLGGRTYRFDLGSPVLWSMPPQFGVDSGGGVSPGMVESYGLRPGNPAGVTVLEGVTAPAAHLEAGRRRGGPATASGYVHWLATRPGLHTSTPRRTTVGGRPAWQVRVSLKAHPGPLTGRCNAALGGTPCYPLTYQDAHRTTGIWGDMVADYTAVRIPGFGTAVVWSWAFGHDRAALGRNRSLVAGLSWPDS